MALKKTHHVVKNPSGKWAVRKAGAQRASGTFRTQREAIESANTISQNQGSRVVVHNANGRIKR